MSTPVLSGDNSAKMMQLAIDCYNTYNQSNGCPVFYTYMIEELPVPSSVVDVPNGTATGMDHLVALDGACLCDVALSLEAMNVTEQIPFDVLSQLQVLGQLLDERDLLLLNDAYEEQIIAKNNEILLTAQDGHGAKVPSLLTDYPNAVGEEVLAMVAMGGMATQPNVLQSPIVPLTLRNQKDMTSVIEYEGVNYTSSNWFAGETPKFHKNTPSLQGASEAVGDTCVSINGFVNENSAFLILRQESGASWENPHYAYSIPLYLGTFTVAFDTTSGAWQGWTGNQALFAGSSLRDAVIKHRDKLPKNTVPLRSDYLYTSEVYLPLEVPPALLQLFAGDIVYASEPRGYRTVSPFLRGYEKDKSIGNGLSDVIVRQDIEQRHYSAHSLTWLLPSDSIPPYEVESKMTFDGDSAYATQTLLPDKELGAYTYSPSKYNDMLETSPIIVSHSHHGIYGWLEGGMLAAGKNIESDDKFVTLYDQKVNAPIDFMYVPITCPYTPITFPYWENPYPCVEIPTPPKFILDTTPEEPIPGSVASGFNRLIFRWENYRVGGASRKNWDYPTGTILVYLSMFTKDTYGGRFGTVPTRPFKSIIVPVDVLSGYLNVQQGTDSAYLYTPGDDGTGIFWFGCDHNSLNAHQKLYEPETFGEIDFYNDRSPEIHFELTENMVISVAVARRIVHDLDAPTDSGNFWAGQQEPRYQLTKSLDVDLAIFNEKYHPFLSTKEYTNTELLKCPPTRISVPADLLNNLGTGGKKGADKYIAHVGILYADFTDKEAPFKFEGAPKNVTTYYTWGYNFTHGDTLENPPY